MLKLIKNWLKTVTKLGSTTLNVVDYGTSRMDTYIEQTKDIDTVLDPFRQSMRTLEELLDYKQEIESSTELSDSGKESIIAQIDAKIAIVESKWINEE